MPNLNKEFLTQKDLLDILPFGKTKLYDLLRRRIIPTVKVGRNYVVTRTALYEWFEKYKGKTIH